MKLEKSIYPYNPEARTLPFFLSGIGGSEYQGRVHRPDGYQWHQILFCAAGSGTLEYDEKEVNIGAGDYFFLPKDKPHTYYPNGELWDVRIRCRYRFLKRFGNMRCIQSKNSSHRISCYYTKARFGECFLRRRNDFFCKETGILLCLTRKMIAFGNNRFMLPLQ